MHMKKPFIIAIIIIFLALAYYLFSKSKSSDNPELNDPGKKILSCENMNEKIFTEADLLDRSCKKDDDCLVIGGHACGECINKNADTSEYFSDIEKLRVMQADAFEKKESCNIPAYSCAQPRGCQCENNKCEAI